MSEPITKFCLDMYYWAMGWQEITDIAFGLCEDKNCRNNSEHEYRCDGQVFYKARAGKL